jgi:subtilase family serine protease
MSGKVRMNTWAAIVVIAIAVAGFAFASTVSTITVAGTNAPAGAGAPGEPTPVGHSLLAHSTALKQVQAAAPAAQAPLVTPTGTYTVLQDPDAFDANQDITLQVGLNTPGSFDGLSLSAYSAAVANPDSPLYRHSLSPAEMQDFSVGATAYNAVVGYLSAFGLTVAPTNDMLTIQVTGTPAQLEAAFHTNLETFQESLSSTSWNPVFDQTEYAVNTTTEVVTSADVPVARTFYENTLPLSLPGNLQQFVAGVTGLSGVFMEPQVALPGSLYPGMIASPVGATPSWNTGPTILTPPQALESGLSTPSVSGANYTTSPPGGTGTEYTGYPGAYQYLYPTTLPTLEEATSLWSGAGTVNGLPDMGQGITIADVEVGCINASAIAGYDQTFYGANSQYYLENRITQIVVGNGTFDNCVNTGLDYGWTLETALDLEYAAAMAPLAHIDLVGAASPDFTAFDQAYSVILNYLETGAPTTIPTSVATAYGFNGTPLQSTLPTAVSSVTITSNSYGAGERYVQYFGTPIYLTLENTLLEAMTTAGATNFFASGDDGGTYLSVDTFMPADSTGSTGVGGGQATALGNDGQEFPSTNDWVGLPTFSESICGIDYGINCTTPESFYENYTEQTATANSLASFSFWVYPGGGLGTFSGEEGGGFGTSNQLLQPWWETGEDVYNAGMAVMPQVANAAAFNMTVYFQECFTFSFLPYYYFNECEGPWNQFYGGTSFATPVTAGEWALIEEQANIVTGSPKIGEANPLFFEAHNANQAGVTASSLDPFVPFEQVAGYQFDTGNWNSFTSYFYNLSIDVANDPALPYWWPSIENPVDNGWTFVGGLGLPLASVLDTELFGQLGGSGGLADEPFSILVNSSGTWTSFTQLSPGTTYSFEILQSNGQTGGTFNVETYSDSGLATMQVTNGLFTYDPTYTAASIPSGGDHYGYFYVQVPGSSEGAFVQFGVSPPAATGTLQLCVDQSTTTGTDQVVCSGEAEVTEFTTFEDSGYYNLAAPGVVLLNGAPVNNALITQTIVQLNYSCAECDPTIAQLFPGAVAPGATAGTYLTDASGQFVYWTGAWTAETNGSLYPQIYQMTASYDGLTSNMITVIVEPQAGTIEPSLSLNPAGTAITGSVLVEDAKYLNWVNISVGSAPGQFQNTTYPPVVFTGQVWESGVDTVNVSVDLTNLSSGPITVSIVAEGSNDLSISEPEYNYSFVDVQNPMFWTDPLVFLPTHLTSSAATSDVTGTDTFTFAGVPLTGAVGSLTLVSGDGSSLLSSSLSGTFALNTATLQDGWYSVQFTEILAGATASTQTIAFYVENQIAALTASVNALTAQLASIEAGWASANQTVANELKADLATIASLQQQLAQLDSTSSADSAQIALLQSELTADAAQIAQLQAELAHKHTVATPWYAMFGGAVVLALVVVAALVALAAGFAFGRRRVVPAGKEAPADGGLEERPSERTTVHATPGESMPDWPDLKVPPRQNGRPRGNPLVAAPQRPVAGGPPQGPPGEWMGPPN